MKKIWICIIAAAVVLSGIYTIGSGFIKTGSVCIGDFSVSDDGTEMTVSVFVSSSAGYVRKVTVDRQHDGTLYLDCYSAFGGFNGSIGAKSEYTITIPEDAEAIAIYRGSGSYEEVLKKDSSGNWQKAD